MNEYGRLKPSVARKVREANTSISDVNVGVVRCNECGAAWSPVAQRGGRMPRGWWMCIRGCNWAKKF